MNESSVAVITGANSGMGKAVSAELARTGATVVMVCRNKERGEAAAEEVRNTTGNPAVDLMLCDLGRLSSIESFCTSFSEKYSRLDVLINNAGVILPGRHETSDGFELQFGVNHLGHFLLTNRLIGLIMASAPSRIINVSSGAHKIGNIHFEDINLEKKYKIWRAYGQSKLANVLFTYKLAEHLKGTGVTANCLHPGAVSTNMGINRETGFGKSVSRLLKPFFQTPEQGAETTIYLATSSDVKGITGKYFYQKKVASSSKKSQDKELADKLWKRSEEMTGLNEAL